MSDPDLHRLIVEHSPDALSYHDPAGGFLLASPACTRVLCCSPDDLLGRSLDEIVDPEDAGRVRLAWEEAQRSPRAASARYRLPRSDAPVRWVETTMQAVPGRGAVCSSRDVTAEVLAEAEAAARRERAELAAEHRDNLVALTPGVVWYGPISADLKSSRVAYMSDYLERVTGYTPKQWAETPGFWQGILHPEDKERVLKASSEPSPDGAPQPLYRIFAKDGRIVWLQTYMRNQCDAAGAPVRRYGVTLDVTVYKEAERQIAELLQDATVLRQRVDALVSSVPGIVWEMWHAKDAGASGFCSDHVRSLTGYTPEEWTAQENAWLALMPAEDREAMGAAFGRLIAAGGGSIEHRVLAKDGREIWLENHMVSGRDGKGAPLWTRGVALDITARKHAEQERERLEYEVALQAARVEELSTPLIPVSDEILVMPLIGTIDPARAKKIVARLLRGLADTGATAAIVDMTGVATLGTDSAAALLRIASAGQLLGARVLFTGVRSEVAESLVSLGIDLTGIVTRGSLAGAFTELMSPVRRAGRR